MSPQPAALYIDLRRQPVLETWPEGDFALAYIVTGNLDETQDFFKAHYASLPAIPHITCEITDADAFHMVIRQQAVTRLSLPHALITDGLSQHVALDAIIQWDHRRNSVFYHDMISALLAQGVNHVSVYGLQDFAVWQELQTFLNGQGLFFYERFHAARPGHNSPYQNHLAQGGDVVAIHGWSRFTAHHTLNVKAPRATQYTVVDDATRRSECLLLGLSHRNGVQQDCIPSGKIDLAVRSGLAVLDNDRLCPTDLGLWQTSRLVMLVE